MSILSMLLVGMGAFLGFSLAANGQSVQARVDEARLAVETAERKQAAAEKACMSALADLDEAEAKVKAAQAQLKAAGCADTLSNTIVSLGLERERLLAAIARFPSTREKLQIAKSRLDETQARLDGRALVPPLVIPSQVLNGRDGHGTGTLNVPSFGSGADDSNDDNNHSNEETTGLRLRRKERH